MTTVNLRISGTSFGNPLGDTVDLGVDLDPGAESSLQDLYISHDALVAPITGCAMYVTEYAGGNYLGSSTADDLVELLGWGDGGDGVQLLQDGGSFETIENGYGDIDNEIQLTEDAVTTGTPAGPGQIPVGGEAHLQVKVILPDPIAGGAGYRAFSLVFEYSATS